MAIPQAEEFRRLIEMEVLNIIRELVEKDDTPREKIQQIAQTTLQMIRPGMQLTELYQNVVKLDNLHPELAPVVFKIKTEYEEKYHKDIKNLLEFKIQEKN